ncbi:MAG: hypothetical protein HYY37_04630 [Candidatus Aenigmarchaeota archaeon]|nr:hypothetical protein [Candidatus Aenigmarchaeota archaeon]
MKLQALNCIGRYTPDGNMEPCPDAMYRLVKELGSRMQHPELHIGFFPRTQIEQTYGRWNDITYDKSSTQCPPCLDVSLRYAEGIRRMCCQWKQPADDETDNL